jgi:anti-sigma factor RsiW
MMEINRFNYEAFFILYIDNELTPAEKAEVEAFVSLHPDLASELDMLKDTVLRPESNLVFKDKASLLKDVDNEGLIHEGNYEEYFVLYADDELTADEKRQVEEFIYKHPRLQSELEAFEAARLIPETVAFPGKEKLYRKEKKPAAIVWWRYAAAASVLLVAGMLWMNYRPDEPKKRVAKLKETTKENAPAPRPANNISAASAADVKTPASESREAKVLQQDFAGKKSKEVRSTTAFDNQSSGKRRQQPMVEPEPAVIADPQIARIGDPRTTLADTKAFVTIDAPEETLKTIETVYNQPQEAIHDDRTSTVYIASIPVDNPTIKPFLRKASNLVNRVAAFKRGENRSLSFKNVEIAIQ